MYNKGVNKSMFNEDSSILEASGGRGVVRTVADVGILLAIAVALGKFSWDVKNDYQKRDSTLGNTYSQAGDFVKDNVPGCNDGLYRTMVRKTARGIKELIDQQ